MQYLKISIGIFLVLAASRFIPHPPNFTSLLALSFYVPVVFHSTILFTWGSVILIGLISKYFKFSVLRRIFGSLTGALLFFILTNFGVWLSGYYGLSFEGLIECYIMAIPFFSYTLISTIFFSSIFETIISFKKKFLISNL